MDNPQPLDNLFTKKLFRIPDYQRGYAWQTSQLEAFWEDLINLPKDGKHYTGVLTLKEIAKSEVKEDEKEYWLVYGRNYKMYEIVDGQQRLTTFVIFLQAFIEFFKQLEENKEKEDKDIYITEDLNLEEVVSEYLFKVQPKEGYKTYKFGYTEDNPSYEYLRHNIFNEGDAPSIKETFYTLNLSNAKQYFCEQIKDLYDKEGRDEIQKIYKNLTNNFLFNEYVIQNAFDVFVAFETMNNRGKKLSDLELLKNRLIYLSTLYSNEGLTDAGRSNIREAINEAWKEVYYQLGRNPKQPLK